MRIALALVASGSLLVVACDEPAAPPPSEPAAPPTEQLATTTPPDAPPAAAEPDDVASSGAKAGVLKTVTFPGGVVAVPAAWTPKVREDPPMTAMHVMPAVGMTCDLAVLEGHGTSKQAEEYLAAGANAYNGETVRAPEIEVGGHAFQGIHVTKPKALPDSGAALIEIYAAISGEDLVGIGVTRLERNPVVDEGRRHCLQAFAQLTSKLPAAPRAGAGSSP